MKICHVNLACDFNGGERQTLQLIKQQIREGYQLTVVMNPKSEWIREVRKLGCKIVFAKHYTKAHSKKITKDCVAIHVHEGRAIYWALIQHLFHGVPYIVTRRTDTPLENSWLPKLAYRKAAALIGLSHEIVSKIEEFNDFSNIYKIPSSPINYPVDQNRVDQVWNQFRGKFIVIHAASMLKNKGFNTTVAAAKLLGVSNPRVQFLLLGDGPEREALEHEARGLTNVRFMGKQRDMGTWFAAADLLIHPSYSEGLGSVILEAMGAGLPVIGSNAGGIPDIIDHEISGLLCEPGNAKQLAKQIDQIENDKALRRKIQKGGKEKLKQFDIVHTSSLYKDIYTQVTSKCDIQRVSQ
ncbi:glycosyltransferase family 4 protein [Vibrio rumoiensis]|uniref:Glycosyl transferase n=1 Tax=Vibrio rumoiensis 1S-45 TaxID=1188252 RepID=A0A1E5E623_9VIBR|nr:glycosyltransferase family 4 protein [Vibrio rumoiensis]OEF29472.1 glycosyl transferase [Vibrio rumoiensis 1S-45]